MKVQVIALKNMGEMKAGKEYEMHRETADVLVKHGRVQYKIDYIAEQRQKKVIEPEQTKAPVFPADRKDYTTPKRKYTRRK